MLPDKPSELIRVALADLEKVEKDKHYIVDMSSWHRPLGGGDTCAVCLAGAVIAKSLNATRDESVHPLDLPEYDKLTALDYFRTGSVRSGMFRMGYVQAETCAPHMRVTGYSIDPEQFKRDMIKMAEHLEGRHF